jgi:TonB family protein
MKKSLLILLLLILAKIASAQQLVDTANKNTIFYSVEIRPMFAGPGTFAGFIDRNIIYPLNAYKNKLEGKVLVQIVIKINGQVGDAKIIRPVSAELDSEALRVVRLSRWHPGIQHGTKVAVAFIVPINFKLPQVTKTTDTITGLATDTLLFYKVEQMPQPPKEFGEYMFKTLASDSAHKTTGSIILQFVVEKNGSLSHFLILKSLNPYWDKEIVKVVSNSGTWYPGVKNGKVVRCVYTFPFSMRN